MTITIADGRSELWQWDTARTLAVDADCSQVHFSNKVFGRSIDVDVVDGTAIIPDVLLQTDKDLNVWAFVGTAKNGYTKISKTFKVNRRNKPSDYVFTPTEQITLAELSGRLDRIEESQDPDAIKNAVDDYLEQNPVEAPVQSVNGQTGAVELNAGDVGAIAETELQTAINTALAQAKASGEFDGADGKSAYQYAAEGGYTGTETEFTEKLAQEQLVGTTGTLTPTQVYEAVSAGIPVNVQYTDSTYGLLYFTAFNVAESLNVIVSQTIIYTNVGYILAELMGNKSNNVWGFEATTLPKKTDIPSVLPNPNELTIKIGSTTVTYDGSTAQTVTIDDGTEVSY